MTVGFDLHHVHFALPGNRLLKKMCVTLASTLRN
jgi:hypothetical protein